MTETAKEAARRYKREWYAKNPQKRREYQERYWTKKAAQERQKAAESGNPAGGE